MSESFHFLFMGVLFCLCVGVLFLCFYSILGFLICFVFDFVVVWHVFCFGVLIFIRIFVFVWCSDCLFLCMYWFHGLVLCLCLGFNLLFFLYVLVLVVCCVFCFLVFSFLLC